MLPGALFAPGLPFDGWLAAMSAQAEGLGLRESLLESGPLSFLLGFGGQRDSLLFGVFRLLLFLGIVCSWIRLLLFPLGTSASQLDGFNKKLSFGMLYPATTWPTRRRTQLWRPWLIWAVPGGALRPNSRLRRATWGWTSTRPAPGRVGITMWPCACWPERSC